MSDSLAAKEKMFERAKVMFCKTEMLSGTPEAIEAAYTVLDTHNDLYHGNPPVDTTPRIGGWPLSRPERNVGKGLDSLKIF